MSEPLTKNKRKAVKSPSEEERESESESETPKQTPVTGRLRKRRKADSGLGLENLGKHWQLKEEEEEEEAEQTGRRPRAAKNKQQKKKGRGGLRAKPKIPKAPSEDALGRRIWRGDRGILSWYDNVKQAMESIRGGGCQIQTNPSCTGNADQIDHIKDFATEQTGLPEQDICVDDHHWKVILHDTARQLYNGGFTEEDTILGNTAAMNELARHFQWSCKKCNSSKSGTKGLDGGAPRYLGECPGEGDCTL